MDGRTYLKNFGVALIKKMDEKASGPIDIESAKELGCLWDAYNDMHIGLENFGAHYGIIDSGPGLNGISPLNVGQNPSYYPQGASVPVTHTLGQQASHYDVGSPLPTSASTPTPQQAEINRMQQTASRQQRVPTRSY